MNNEEATFNICRSMRQSSERLTVSAISYRVEISSELQKLLGVEELVAMIINFECDGIEEYGPLFRNLIEVTFDSNNTNWS